MRGTAEMSQSASVRMRGASTSGFPKCSATGISWSVPQAGLRCSSASWQGLSLVVVAVILYPSPGTSLRFVSALSLKGRGVLHSRHFNSFGFLLHAFALAQTVRIVERNLD